MAPKIPIAALQWRIVHGRGCWRMLRIGSHPSVNSSKLLEPSYIVREEHHLSGILRGSMVNLHQLAEVMTIFASTVLTSTHRANVHQIPTFNTLLKAALQLDLTRLATTHVQWTHKSHIARNLTGTQLHSFDDIAAISLFVAVQRNSPDAVTAAGGNSIFSCIISFCSVIAVITSIFSRAYYFSTSIALTASSTPTTDGYVAHWPRFQTADCSDGWPCIGIAYAAGWATHPSNWSRSLAVTDIRPSRAP